MDGNWGRNVSRESSRRCCASFWQVRGGAGDSTGTTSSEQLGTKQAQVWLLRARASTSIFRSRGAPSVEVLRGTGLQALDRTTSRWVLLAAVMTAGHLPAAGSSGARIRDERDDIARAKTDPNAFEELYRAHIGKVYGLCLRMTGNPSEAEECAQEAFIQAWKKLDQFRGRSSFATWIHRVAVNVVLGRIRKSRREQDRIREAEQIAPVRETIGDSGELRDLEHAMNELPTGARHVFVLHAVYGYSHDETGEMLGIAAGTSKAQLHRAKRLLAQQLEQRPQEGTS